MFRLDYLLMHILNNSCFITTTHALYKVLCFTFKYQNHLFASLLIVI